MIDGFTGVANLKSCKKGAKSKVSRKTEKRFSRYHEVKKVWLTEVLNLAQAFLQVKILWEYLLN
jgi:hypothetical protein